MAAEAVATTVATRGPPTAPAPVAQALLETVVPGVANTVAIVDVAGSAPLTRHHVASPRRVDVLVIWQAPEPPALRSRNQPRARAMAAGVRITCVRAS